MTAAMPGYIREDMAGYTRVAMPGCIKVDQPIYTTALVQRVRVRLCGKEKMMTSSHIVKSGEFLHVLDGAKADILNGGRAAVHGGFVIVRYGGYADIYDDGHALVYAGGFVTVHRNGWAYIFAGGHADGHGEIVWEEDDQAPTVNTDDPTTGEASGSAHREDTYI
jgi:hypothetical protein